jgi:hypothetical protein
MRPAANRCTAKAKQSGKQCQLSVVPGSTKCRIHGGLTPRGIASPHFKTGKYSAYMPERLLERYHDAIADPALLELDHEIALVDSRLADLLTRVDTGEAAKNWKEARNINDEIQAALLTENYGAVVVACTALARLITPSLNDYEAWNQLSALLDQRRKMVESQRKRMIEQQQFVTVEQALLLVTAMIDSVKRNVKDRDALNAISLDVAKLTNRVSIEAVSRE